METWQIIVALFPFGIALALLYYCSKLKTQNAPLYSQTYLSLTDEEKKYFDKDSEYKRLRILYGIIGVFFIVVGIAVLTMNKVFAYLSIVVLASALVFEAIKLIQLRKKVK